MTMTESIVFAGGFRRRGAHQSGWRKFLDEVLQPRTGNVEGEIVEYLQCHRHDLPPEVGIELERLGP
jgi:hypothetical protein